MNILSVANTKIEIYVGNITESNCDAIVLNGNSRLLPSGKIRCSALREAGSTVQVACNQIINRISKLEIGAAVITPAGDLKAKFIIHTNGPKFGTGKEGKKLMLTIWNSLKLASSKSVETIAFTPISIDMYGFSTKLVAKAMLPTLKKYVFEHPQSPIKEIYICLRNLPEYLEFEKILNGLN